MKEITNVSHDDATKKKIYDSIRAIPDFPKKGIIFRDITPLLLQPMLLKETIKLMVEPIKDKPIDKIVAIESRGFIFAPLIATQLNISMVLARKPGKLPGACIEAQYILEYGNNILQMHQDAINPNDNVLIIDDVLATGGTALAVQKLIIQAKGKLYGHSFLIELSDLKGRDKLGKTEVHSIIQY